MSFYPPFPPPYPPQPQPGSPGQQQAPYPPPNPQQPYRPQPYYAEGAWRPYRPSKGLAIGATVCAGVVALFEIVEAGLAYGAGETYAEAARAGVPVDNIFTGYDIGVVFWYPAIVAAYVLTCLWLRRVRTNADAIDPIPHTRSSGWVWAGWWVPVVSLWFPFQIVRDIRDISKPPYSPNALIGWWWTAWLGYLLASRIGSRLVPLSGQASEGSASALGPVETVNAGFALVAFVLWCLVVRTIVREQDAAVRQVSQA